jgi:hypothetical protein
VLVAQVSLIRHPPTPDTHLLTVINGGQLAQAGHYIYLLKILFRIPLVRIVYFDVSNDWDWVLLFFISSSLHYLSEFFHENIAMSL